MLFISEKFYNSWYLYSTKYFIRCNFKIIVRLLIVAKIRFLRNKSSCVDAIVFATSS